MNKMKVRAAYVSIFPPSIDSLQNGETLNKVLLSQATCIKYRFPYFNSSLVDLSKKREIEEWRNSTSISLKQISVSKRGGQVLKVLWNKIANRLMIQEPEAEGEGGGGGGSGGGGGEMF